MDDATLTDLARRLLDVGGVDAVVLGGSRARGTHRPDSDYDLGLYYRGALDRDALQALATEASDGPAEVTAPGGWGPWVDGGGWLRIGGAQVDWIYRDVARVRAVWADCRKGRYETGFQPGHPLGFYSHAYAGELAMCRVLADRTGEITGLRDAVGEYPDALAEALVAGLWEADFLVGGARKGAAGGDAAYVAGCLFRAVGVVCQALHGHARRWVINEKGMVAAAGRLPACPEGFAERVEGLFAGLGGRPEALEQALDAMAALAADVRAAVGG